MDVVLLHGLGSSRFDPQSDGSQSHAWPHAFRSIGTSVPTELSNHGPPASPLSGGAEGNNAWRRMSAGS
jgi:hypothetical protein